MGNTASDQHDSGRRGNRQRGKQRSFRHCGRRKNTTATKLLQVEVELVPPLPQGYGTAALSLSQSRVLATIIDVYMDGQNMKTNGQRISGGKKMLEAKQLYEDAVSRGIPLPPLKDFLRYCPYVVDRHFRSHLRHGASGSQLVVTDDWITEASRIIDEHQVTNIVGFELAWKKSKVYANLPLLIASLFPSKVDKELRVPTLASKKTKPPEPAPGPAPVPLQQRQQNTLALANHPANLPAISRYMQFTIIATYPNQALL